MLCGPSEMEDNPDGQPKERQSLWQRLRDRKRLLSAVEEGDVSKVRPWQPLPAWQPSRPHES